MTFYNPNQTKTSHLTKMTSLTASLYDSYFKLWLGRETQFRQMIINLMGLTGDESVLDIGCGTGTLTSMIAQKMNGKGSIFGIDLSPRMIEIARKKTNSQGSQVEYRVGSALALPFDNETFDVAVTSLVYHQLFSREEKVKTLSEIRRVLKPEGRYIAAEFTRFTLGNLGVTHDSLIRGIRPFTPELLEKNGFHVPKRMEPVRGITIISAERGKPV